MKQLTEENKNVLNNIAYSITRLSGQFEDSYEFLTRGKGHLINWFVKYKKFLARRLFLTLLVMVFVKRA